MGHRISATDVKGTTRSVSTRLVLPPHTQHRAHDALTRQVPGAEPGDVLMERSPKSAGGGHAPACVTYGASLAPERNLNRSAGWRTAHSPKSTASCSLSRGRRPVIDTGRQTAPRGSYTAGPSTRECCGLSGSRCACQTHARITHYSCSPNICMRKAHWHD